MRAATTATRSTAPAVPTLINFAATPSKLAGLIAAFVSAEQALNVACTAEDEFSPIRKERPSVLGGILPESRLVIEGRPDGVCPASEWFYNSMDQIERDRGVHLAGAKTAAERRSVTKRFAGLRAEFSRQEKAIADAVPAEYRILQRNLEAAHRAVSAAEAKIIAYKPKSLAECVTLLEYVSGEQRANCFSTEQSDLHTIMLHVADAIRRAA